MLLAANTIGFHVQELVLLAVLVLLLVLIIFAVRGIFGFVRGIRRGMREDA